MKLYKLEREQFIRTDQMTLWDFISSPRNLGRITPDDMHFEILSTDADDKIYSGKIIIYKIMPFTGKRFNWITEITQVKEPDFFIDEQVRGPYSYWHHEHRLLKTNGGTLMQDLIYYGIPGGIFGRILNRLIIHKKLNKIFDFRFQKLLEIFPE